MSQETIEKKLAYLDETKQMIGNALITKGQIINNETPFRDYVQKVLDIQTGYDTRDATAVASEVLKGKTFYNAQGKVEGTLVPKTGEVKKFATIKEMQSDANAQEGDLALVYESNIGPWNGSDTITSLTFPKTVILPQAETGSCYGYASGNVWIDIEGSISSTTASFRIYGENYYTIRYTSTDGLIYNRTDTGDESILLSDTSIKITMYEYSTVCGYFMQVGNYNFEGLYEYNNGYSLAPTQLTADSSYILPGKTAYGKNGLIEGTDAVYDNINWSSDVISKIPTDIFLNHLGSTFKVSSATPNTGVASDKANKLYSLSNSISDSIIVTGKIDTSRFDKWIQYDFGLMNGWNSGARFIYSHYIVTPITADGKNYIAWEDTLSHTFDCMQITTNLSSSLFCSFTVDISTGDLYAWAGANRGYYSHNSSSIQSTMLTIYKIDIENKQFSTILNISLASLCQSTSSKALQNLGIRVDNGISYIGFTEMDSSYNEAFKIFKAVDGVVSSLYSTGFSADTNYPRMESHPFASHNQIVVDRKLFFIKFTSTSDVLSYIDLDKGTITDIQTLSHGTVRDNRAYNNTCFYLVDNKLYFLCSFGTDSTWSSSSSAYKVQLYKFNLDSSTLTKLSAFTYSHTRGDDGSRMIAYIRNNNLIFSFAYNSVIVNLTNDQATITGDIYASLGYYEAVAFADITILTGNGTNFTLIAENKTLINNTSSVTFLSTTDLNKYALAFGDFYTYASCKATLSPEEYQTALDTAYSIRDDEV